MKSDIVNDYFWNKKYALIKKHITSSTGLQNNATYPLCRTRNNGLMAASLVDVQNIVNLTGGIPGMSGPANSVQNYGGGISTNSCLMNPNLSSKQIFLDNLQKQVTINDNGFCLLYYSGHGTRDGELCLSNNNLISPHEIFEVSKKKNLPFLIILDMCHAGKFGEEYLKLIRENNWQGIVLCSSRSDEQSYEHGLMRLVQYNSKPIIIQGMMKPNLSLGQGVFSAAFLVALQQLKANGKFTFQEFIEKINESMKNMRNLIKNKTTNPNDTLREQTACYYK